MIDTTQVTVSPVLMEEIMGFLPAELPAAAKRREAEPWVQEIIGNAKRFVERFCTLPFFAKESHHEFTGIVLRDSKGNVQNRFDFIMQCSPPELGIFSRTEVVMDELYLVRKVIAESSFPEFSQDLWPSFYARN